MKFQGVVLALLVPAAMADGKHDVTIKKVPATNVYGPNYSYDNGKTKLEVGGGMDFGGNPGAGVSLTIRF